MTKHMNPELLKEKPVIHLKQHGSNVSLCNKESDSFDLEYSKITCLACLDRALEKQPLNEGIINRIKELGGEVPEQEPSVKSLNKLLLEEQEPEAPEPLELRARAVDWSDVEDKRVVFELQCLINTVIYDQQRIVDALNELRKEK